jgi:hypothetical protein
MAALYEFGDAQEAERDLTDRGWIQCDTKRGRRKRSLQYSLGGDD